MTWLLALAEGLGWEKLAGFGGAGVLAYFVYLFLAGRICTKADADKRVEEWKELHRQQAERLERAEQRLLDSLSMARRSTEIASSAVERAKREA